MYTIMCRTSQYQVSRQLCRKAYGRLYTSVQSSGGSWAPLYDRLQEHLFAFVFDSPSWKLVR